MESASWGDALSSGSDSVFFSLFFSGGGRGRMVGWIDQLGVGG